MEDRARVFARRVKADRVPPLQRALELAVEGGQKGAPTASLAIRCPCAPPKGAGFGTLAGFRAGFGFGAVCAG